MVQDDGDFLFMWNNTTNHRQRVLSEADKHEREKDIHHSKNHFKNLTRTATKATAATRKKESDQLVVKNNHKELISNNVSNPAAKGAPDSDQAVILFNDGNLQKQHQQQFSSFSQGAVPAQAWYESCQTTLILIIVLHLVFFQQWNKKRTKKDTLVSYRILVQYKHYYRAIIAFMTHPPVDMQTMSTSDATSSSLDVHMGSDDWRDRGTRGSAPNDSENGSNRSGMITRFFQRYLWNFAIVRTWYPTLRTKLIQPLWYGHLSGLPLLVYNCHILWSCRALERAFVESTPTASTSPIPSVSSPWQYARILLGLTMVALLLELWSSHAILKSPLGGNIFPGPALVGTRQQQFIQRKRQQILHQSIGTPTVLTAALLIVYRQTYRYVPLQVLPFVRILPTNFADPTISFYFIMLVLTVLSWRTTKSATCVFYGFVSGLLWNWGLTTFLAELNWSLCLVLILVILTALSMHSSSPSFLAIYVPCIDYVAWNSLGVIRIQGESNTNISSPAISLANDNPSREGNHNNDSVLNDEGDIESRPLLPTGTSRRRNSNMVDEGDGQDIIHGRLPLMAMDSDIVDR